VLLSIPFETGRFDCGGQVVVANDEAEDVDEEDERVENEDEMEGSGLAVDALGAANKCLLG
jgi:hypothetical protein